MADPNEGPPLLSFVANALVENVALDPAVRRIVTLSLFSWRFGKLQGRWGGVWVGGRIRLTRDKLTFEPNRLNREIQIGDMSRAYPLSDLTSVTRRFGVVTGIVDADFGGKHLIFRCFRADRAMNAIEAAAPRRDSA